jgi:hypothetical protein
VDRRQGWEASFLGVILASRQVTMMLAAATGSAKPQAGMGRTRLTTMAAPIAAPSSMPIQSWVSQDSSRARLRAPAMPLPQPAA